MNYLKNHKLIKIFQREDYESERTDGHLNQLKEKNIKINTVFVRMSPIMETLTGIMIAILIFYSGKLAINNEIEIGIFSLSCCNDACIPTSKISINDEYGIKTRIICSQSNSTYY